LKVSSTALSSRKMNLHKTCTTIKQYHQQNQVSWEHKMGKKRSCW
jgi:hypothetical protein